jgi:hypothetical protein
LSFELKSGAEEEGFSDEPCAALERGSPLLRLRPSLNSALGLKSGLVGAVAAGPSPEKVYEEDEVAGNEPGGVSTLKVNCIRLIMPGRAFWEASRERSRSTAR